MTRVLAGAVVGHEPEVVEPYAETLQQTAEASDADVDFTFIRDPEETSTEVADLLPGETTEGEPKPDEAEYAVSEGGHSWSEATFNWLAAHKQKLLNTAQQEHYDYVFLVDSDLLLGPETLSSLLAAEKPITSAVFWTRWQRQHQPLPQVWLTMPYQFTGRGYDAPHEFFRRLDRRKLTQVWGLGACTLIDTSVLNRTGFYPRLQGLPQGGMWRGEDRSFCIRAERNHVSMWADPWPDVYHVYRPSQQDAIPQVREALADRNLAGPPALDDLVSATVEPLEEPGLAGHTEHLRGTLGRLDIRPDLRDELREMRAGEERLTRVEFPEWWPEMPTHTQQGLQDIAGKYRGEEKLVRLTLHHVKPEEEHFKP